MQGPYYTSVYPRAPHCAVGYAIKNYLGRENGREEERKGGRNGGREGRRKGQEENVFFVSLLVFCNALHHLN